eukprot:658368-Prymnesium_polylepis.1
MALGVTAGRRGMGWRHARGVARGWRHTRGVARGGGTRAAWHGVTACAWRGARFSGGMSCEYFLRTRMARRSRKSCSAASNSRAATISAVLAGANRGRGQRGAGVRARCAAGQGHARGVCVERRENAPSVRPSVRR